MEQSEHPSEQNAHHIDERRQVGQMAAMNRIARRISATLDLRDTLDSIVEAAYGLIPCALAEISLWDGTSQLLTLQALRCEPERAFPLGRSYPPGEGYTGWLVRHEEPLLVPDVDAREDIHPDLLPGELPFISYLGVPLIATGELIGTLVLIRDERKGFDEDDLALLESLAAQAAVAIRNASLYEELARRHRELAALHSVAGTANRPLPLDDLLQQALDQAIDVTRAGAGAVRLLHPDSGQITLMAHRGLSENYVHQMRSFTVSQDIAGLVARSGAGVLSEDMWEDDRISREVRVLLREEGYRSLAQVPLRAQNEVVGTLGVTSEKIGLFHADDLDLLDAIGQQLGVAVARARLFQEVQQKADELSALCSVSEAVSGSLDPEEVLQQALTGVVEVTGGDGAAIRLLDRTTKSVALAAQRGLSEDYVRQASCFPISEEIIGWVARSGEPTLSEDMWVDPRVTPEVRALLRREGQRALAAVPLLAHEEVVGTLGVMSREEGFFDEEDLSLLNAIGQQVGVAVTNANLFEETRRRSRELVALNAVAAATNRAQRLEVLLADAVERVIECIKADGGGIRLLDPTSGELSLSISRGLSEAYVNKVNGLRLGEGIVGDVALTGEPTLLADMREDPRIPSTVLGPLHEEGIRSFAVVPLRSQEEVVGTLGVVSHTAGAFGPADVDLLTAMGHQIGIAIANAELRQEAIDAERLAAVGQVAASVAHELRSPLGGIMRSAEFLARPELSESTRRKLSSAIVAMARRLINTSQELLDYTRGGRMTLRHALCSLPDFLEQVLEVLRVDFSDRGIAVETEWGYTGRIRFDSDRMAQVVYNIAANARDAMPEGGQLTVATERAEDHVELRFTDTGPGVAPELRERIFEPFVSYGKQEGAGLGLAIAKRIVEEHGGDIEVESPTAGGATFVVRLPIG